MKTIIAYLLPCLLFIFGACRSNEPNRLASAKIEKNHGRMTYLINGKSYFPMIYSTPSFGKLRGALTADGKTNFTNFTRAGIDLFEAPVYIRNAWNEDGTLNTEAIDEELTDNMRSAFAINPNAFFQIRIMLNAPAWWHGKYPEELVNYAKGPVNFDYDLRQPPYGGDGDNLRAPRASMASERWKDESTQMLQKFMDYMQTTDVGNRIYSFMICAGVFNEWHYYGFKHEPDTGDAMTRYFRKWLAAKYQTDEALQKAWQDRQATIATATVPDLAERRQNTGVFRDPQNERRIIDYFYCHHETVAAAIEHFTKYVKTNWPSDVLVGIFNGYFFCHDDFNSGGHLTFDRILKWPYIDFIASPFNYHKSSRELGGNSQPRAIVESINLHGKQYMSEQDGGTHLSYPNGLKVDSFRNEDESISRMRSPFAQMVNHATGYWFFDFGDSGNWNSSAMMAEVQHQKDYCDALLKHEYTSVADVAFIYDFNTYYYLAETDNRQTNEIQNTSASWMTADAYRSGAAFDTYLLNDLPLMDIDRYKVFVFATTYYMTDEQIDFINTKIKKDGRTVIFTYAPGYTDGEKLDIDRIKALTGVNVRQISMDVPPQITVNGTHYGLTESGEAGKFTVSPLFEICCDNDTEVLAKYRDSDMTAIVKKRNPDHTVVYAALPLRNPDFMRRLFQEAGAHIYGDANDVILAGNSMVCVSTREDAGGKRIIHLKNGKQVTLELKPASTVIIDDQTGTGLFD
ncbi:MAG: beta-galactosidase trimerization domain-containing protein [Tannerella sp.]|jgi:hypothetical protein|nr:beta-galactosidase trimerization domain-containing protein [Tannerella sp.]